MENICGHGAGHQLCQSTALILCGTGNKTSQGLEARSSGELMSKTERRAAFTALCQSSSFQKPTPEAPQGGAAPPVGKERLAAGPGFVSHGLCGHGACPGARTGSRRLLLTHRG